MAGFSDAALYLKVTGTIAAVQGWSTGFWLDFGGGTAVTPASVDAWLDGIVTTVEAWATSLQGLWSTDTVLTQLDGAYFPAGATVASVQGTAAVGGVGAGTVAMPSYCSLVASLETAHAGRSYRGRSYCPLTAAEAMDGVTHEVIEGNTITVANAYAALFNFLNGYSPDNPLVGGQVSVGSRSKGVLTPVLSVRVDSRPDTQRRREDKLAPLFVHAAPVVPGG